MYVATGGIKSGERKLKIGVNNFEGRSSFQEEGAHSRDLAWNIMPNHIASFLSGGIDGIVQVLTCTILSMVMATTYGSNKFSSSI